MKTEETNKIIAEFMGWEIKNYSTPISDIVTPYGQLTETQLKFNSDWNWLMEVVEKIESLGYWIEILGGVHNVCRIGITNNIEDFICLDNETKIEAVYNTCVTFIEWYNEQKSV